MMRSVICNEVETRKNLNKKQLDFILYIIKITQDYVYPRSRPCDFFIYFFAVAIYTSYDISIRQKTTS